MNALQRIGVIVWYEWKRALAKKSLIALLILAVSFEVFPFMILSGSSFSFMGTNIRETMWLTGVLAGQSLFVQLIAMQIAGSSMSEEYEQGTADVLLSKPITRGQYLIGKFLGGILLLSFVEVITTVTALVLSYGIFGTQRDIQFVPVMFVAIIYSILVFYSLTFMFSEFLRRSNLAMFAGFGVFMVSQIAGIFSAFSTGQLYGGMAQLLPTWSATAFPVSLAADLNVSSGSFFVSALTLVVPGDTRLAAAIIAVYTLIFFLLAYVRFAKSDVTKKTA